jgi:hypothetical protein
MGLSRKKSVFIVVALIGAVALAGMGGAALFLSRYVRTEYDVPSDAAARQFEQTRARFTGQRPFIEYQGLQPPIVRRDWSAPRRRLVALHGLVYDADAQELRRGEVPWAVLRVMSAGGRLRLINLGMFGDDRDRIALEDLERHGPGLIFDVRAGQVAHIVAVSAIFGRTSPDSRVLVWSE